MPKYNPNKVDPERKLARSTRKKTVVTNIARKHFLKTFKRMQRQKAREEKARLAGKKSLKSMRSDISIYTKLTHKCKRIGEFADFLLELDDRITYDGLVKYIDAINNELIEHLKAYKGMTIVRNYTKTSDDRFKTLIELSEHCEDIGDDLLEQSTTDNIIKPTLQKLTKFIKKIYKQLTDALESFEGELELAAQVKREEAERQRQAAAMNEEGGNNNNNNEKKNNNEKNNNNNNNNGNASNDAGLNAIMAKFRNLGLGN
jgi:hypothetical protein